MEQIIPRGFGSAAKFLATCVLDIQMDMESYPGSNRITILEAMGRHTGWLAAACSLADTEESQCQQIIYIPESPFEMGKCLEKVSTTINEKRNSIIIVSEGIKDTNGNLFGGSNIKEDVFRASEIRRCFLIPESSYCKRVRHSNTVH
ncbi:6-phosphofructokinase [Peribacillus frigoritolerans]|nr:6-phosphofructokinase [Peribacillus frigoritolerans]